LHYLIDLGRVVNRSSLSHIPLAEKRHHLFLLWFVQFLGFDISGMDLRDAQVLLLEKLLSLSLV
jgi:hypothetical protein